jgi:hypothetical protein
MHVFADKIELRLDNAAICNVLHFQSLSITHCDRPRPPFAGRAMLEPVS